MYLNIKQKSLFKNGIYVAGLLFKFCRHCPKFITFQQTLKWYNQWKVRRVVLKNMPLGGPIGNQNFLRGTAPKESLITCGTSRGKNFLTKTEEFPLFFRFSD